MHAYTNVCRNFPLSDLNGLGSVSTIQGFLMYTSTGEIWVNVCYKVVVWHSGVSVKSSFTLYPSSYTNYSDDGH